MSRTLFYLGFLASLMVGLVASFPQLVCAESNKGCMVIWTASQGELRFPDKNYGESGLSLTREPGDEDRIFRTNEIVAGNITPSTSVSIRNWEPERAREILPLLAGKRVSIQAKVRNCGEGEAATSEILEISIVQLPGRVSAYEPSFNLKKVTLGLAALAILSGGGRHEGSLPEPQHNSPFNMPPPKEPY